MKTKRPNTACTGQFATLPLKMVLSARKSCSISKVGSRRTAGDASRWASSQIDLKGADSLHMETRTDHLKKNAEKWDRRAGTYDSKFLDIMRFMQYRTLMEVSKKENIQFLDIGCGTGWAVRKMAELTNNSGQYFGIDISPTMIKQAINSTGNKTCSFQEASSDKLPFENDLFDSILCSNSFHHYPEPEKALQEMYRVLKRGGRIYITDFTTDGYFSRKVDDLFRSREKEHIKFHSTEEMKGYYKVANFKYIEGKRIIFPVMRIHIGEK